MAEDFFEKLRKIQLSERRHATLAIIDDELYSELKKRLTELGSGDAGFGDDREFRNVCAIGRDIVSRRRQKIVAKAQRDLASGMISSEGLASEEREFYLSFVGLLKRMDSILEPVEGAQVKLRCDPRPAAGQAAKDAAALSTKVRMLADVPEFLSSSMDTLGPFSSSQVVDLPFDDAELLVNRNLALAVKEAR
jgi:DNA replication initiation complex subunit (GINS family)